MKVCPQAKSSLRAFGVYRIVNTVNGKSYIGSTGRSFQVRKSEHIRLLESGVHFNNRLQASWNKHGGCAFEFSVVEALDSIDSLCPREQVWIDRLGAEYNICPVAGSVRGTRHSEESRRKMSESRKGKPLPPQHRQNISLALKAIGMESWSKGKTLDADTRAKMSESHKGKVFSEAHRRNLSESQKGNKKGLGKKKSLEVRMKISQSKIGGKHSEETKAKLRAAWVIRKQRMQEEMK